MVKSAKNWLGRSFRRSRRSLMLGIISLLLVTAPVRATGEIIFVLAPFSRSLQVSSLETFAKDGTIDRNLRQFLQDTTPEQQTAFREALTKKTAVNPVLLWRFFNSEVGEAILVRLGSLLTIEGNINGKFALRSALVKAAFEPEGLTLLNFLQSLPTNMQVNVRQVMELTRTIDLVLQATNHFTAEVAKLSLIEAKKDDAIDFSQLTDLRRPGSFKVQQKRLILTDSKRNRTFYLLIFQPDRPRGEKTPVIVFSHGLASRPEDFARQAEHWASYGYFVALPQHPGSDTIQIQNLIEGLSRQVFERQEFIDRPLDISYVIDELERRNATEFGGQLDLENVGVGGHSFGGYAALAVAGAKIDFDYLETECQREFGYINISRILQCRALALPRQEYNFLDRRVKAVFAANPVNNSIFGPKGLAAIQVPVFLAAGTYDPATPAIFEQVRSFPWLTTKDKYLAMIEGQAHVDFSVLDAGMTQAIESVVNLTLPPPYLIDNYANALSLAFFEVHLAKNSRYRPFLTAAYPVYLSQDQPFKCYLISRASSLALTRSMEEFLDRYVQ